MKQDNQLINVPQVAMQSPTREFLVFFFLPFFYIFCCFFRPLPGRRNEKAETSLIVRAPQDGNPPDECSTVLLTPSASLYSDLCGSTSVAAVFNELADVINK